MIYVIATLKIKVDTRQQVVAAAIPCVKATRQEVGCHRYDLLADVDDPTVMTFVEEWESREALEAHFATPHIKAWREASKPFVASAEVVVVHPERVERI